MYQKYFNTFTQCSKHRKQQALTSIKVVFDGRHFLSIVDDDQMRILMLVMTSIICTWPFAMNCVQPEASMSDVVECETTAGRTS